MSECNSIENSNLTYYQRNRDVKLNRAKKYYENNKERLREQAKDKYRNLSGKGKKKKRLWEDAAVCLRMRKKD